MRKTRGSFVWLTKLYQHTSKQVFTYTNQILCHTVIHLKYIVHILQYYAFAPAYTYC